MKIVFSYMLPKSDTFFVDHNLGFITILNGLDFEDLLDTKVFYIY